MHTIPVSRPRPNGHLEALDGDLDSKDGRLEWKLEVLGEHVEEAHDLIGFVVGVDDRVLHHRVQCGYIDLCPSWLAFHEVPDSRSA